MVAQKVFGSEFLFDSSYMLSDHGAISFDKEEGVVAAKLAELEDLRDEVRAARNKWQLAKMVIRFGEAHRGKHDKKATKVSDIPFGYGDKDELTLPK